MTDPAQTSRPAPIWLLVALQGGVSAMGLVVEIVAARMIAPYVGMSLYTWTAIIAVVLTGFSIGHWWGGRLASRSSARALASAGWVLMAAAFLTVLASLILRVSAGPVLQAVENPLMGMAVLTTLAFFLPSLLAGVPAPILAVVAMRSRAQSEHALGVMFAAGAVGAIAGTLLAGFVFISWLGSVTTLAVVAATYALSAAICLALGRIGRGAAALAAVAVAAVGLAGLRAGAMPDACDVESGYFCIRTVALAEDVNGPVNLMVLDHLAHGVSARDAPRVMYTDHTAMLDALPRMRMGQTPFTSFHIGGGTYSVPRAWSARGAGQITVAEIDPAVTRQAIRDFWFDPATALVLHDDARRALRISPDRYDVIVGDAFTDIAVPAHLVTREFFQLVSDRLSDQGIYAMNVIDNVDRLSALAALYATLREVFDSVEVWTEARAPAPGERRVFVLLAGANDSPVSLVTARTPGPKRFAPLERGFLDGLVLSQAAPILTDDFAPIDRLMGLDPVLE